MSKHEYYYAMDLLRMPVMSRDMTDILFFVN